jgi:transposase-like protein
MAARPNVDVSGCLDTQLAAGKPGLLRAIKTFAEALMGAEADAVCGAAYAQRSPERVNRRNGYRQRGWGTRAGTVELATPSCQGSYFPDWLLERRRRAEQALVTVVAASYLLGVSAPGGWSGWSRPWA